MTLRNMINYALALTLSLRDRYGISWEQAEDISQDAAIKIWLHEPRLGYEKRKQWVNRVVVNCIVDFLRSKAWHKEIKQTPLEEIDPFELAHHYQTPYEAVEGNEKTEEVHFILSLLSPPCRRTLTGRYYEQLSYKEIAERDRVALGTVKSRIVYSQKRFRALAEQYDISFL